MFECSQDSAVWTNYIIHHVLAKNCPLWQPGLVLTVLAHTNYEYTVYQALISWLFAWWNVIRASKNLLNSVWLSFAWSQCLKATRSSARKQQSIRWTFGHRGRRRGARHKSHRSPDSGRAQSTSNAATGLEPVAGSRAHYRHGALNSKDSGLRRRRKNFKWEQEDDWREYVRKWLREGQTGWGWGVCVMNPPVWTFAARLWGSN